MVSIVTPRNHYEVLGVRRDASAADIRDAYRRLARQHHPDHTATPVVSAELMPAVNEAYRVLSDPGRRAMYDASQRTAQGGPATASNGAAMEADVRPPPHPRLSGPVRVPWRPLLVVGVVAAIGIVVLAQFTDPGEPAGPDGILRVGDCVVFEANNDAREVACTGSGDNVVRAFVPFDARCPGGTEAHRDRQGMGIACVEVAVETPG